jgi:hypothetical protein
MTSCATTLPRLPHEVAFAALLKSRIVIPVPSIP